MYSPPPISTLISSSCINCYSIQQLFYSLLNLNGEIWPTVVKRNIWLAGWGKTSCQLHRKYLGVKGSHRKPIYKKGMISDAWIRLQGQRSPQNSSAVNYITWGLLRSLCEIRRGIPSHELLCVSPTPCANICNRGTCRELLWSLPHVFNEQSVHSN